VCVVCALLAGVFVYMCVCSMCTSCRCVCVHVYVVCALLAGVCNHGCDNVYVECVGTYKVAYVRGYALLGCGFFVCCLPFYVRLFLPDPPTPLRWWS